MRSLKIFLGGNECFWDNEEALSMKRLEDSYYNALSGMRHLDEIDNMTSCISSEHNRRTLEEKIARSDLCILDVTSLIEDKEFVSHIETIYKICISLDKKMILLHHKDYPIQDWLKLAKEENIISVCEHDGQNIEESFSNNVRTFFKENQNLSPIITLDDTNYTELESLLTPYLPEEGGWYIHIYFKGNAITIDYQGYNTPPLYQITIDITNVSNKWYVEEIIKRGFPEWYNVFYHNEKDKMIVKY